MAGKQLLLTDLRSVDGLHGRLGHCLWFDFWEYTGEWCRRVFHTLTFSALLLKTGAKKMGLSKTFTSLSQAVDKVRPGSVFLDFSFWSSKSVSRYFQKHLLYLVHSKRKRNKKFCSWGRLWRALGLSKKMWIKCLGIWSFKSVISDLLLELQMPTSLSSSAMEQAFWNTLAPKKPVKWTICKIRESQVGKDLSSFPFA